MKSNNLFYSLTPEFTKSYKNMTAPVKMKTNLATKGGLGGSVWGENGAKQKPQRLIKNSSYHGKYRQKALSRLRILSSIRICIPLILN